MKGLTRVSFLSIGLSALVGSCIVPDDFSVVDVTAGKAGAAGRPTPLANGGTVPSTGIGGSSVQSSTPSLSGNAGSIGSGGSAGSLVVSASTTHSGSAGQQSIGGSGFSSGGTTAPSGFGGQFTSAGGSATGGAAYAGETTVSATTGGAATGGHGGASGAATTTAGTDRGGATSAGFTTAVTSTGGSIAGGGTAAGGAFAGSTASGGASLGGASTGGDSPIGGTTTGGFGGQTPLMGSECILLLHLDEAHWDGTPREVKDSSGLLNHGTLSTGASIDTTANPAKFGRAGSFNATGFVDVGDNPSLRPTNALSISAWFDATTVDGIERGIVVKRAGWRDQDAFSVFIWGGDPRDASQVLLYVDVDDDNDRFASDPTKPIVANTWYHVVVTYDGSLPAAERVRLYVNGTLNGTYDHQGTRLSDTHYEASSAIPGSYAGPLQIGNLQNGGQPFIGLIDEVAVWRRALTEQEVVALFWASGPLN